MRKILTIICFVLLAVPSFGADSVYYMAATAVGDEDCTSEANACVIATINAAWATMRTQLASNDVRVKIKRGDTITLTAGWQLLGSTPTNLTYRFYLEDYGTGDKPKIRRSGGTQLLQLDENSNVTLQNLDIAFTGTPSQGSRGLDIQDNDNGGMGGIHVISCDFSNIDFYSLALHGLGNYNIIANNTFTDVGNAIYFIEGASNPGDYNYVGGNTFLRINWNDAFRDTTDGHAISFRNSDYNVIENNTATYCRLPYDIYVTAGNDATYTVIRNNTATYSERPGIDLYSEDFSGDVGSHYAWVYQNTLVDSGYDDGIGPRPQIRVNAFAGTGGVHIMHNTLYNNTAGEWGVEGRDGVDYRKVMNNIIRSNGIGADDDLIYFDPSGETVGANNETNYNLYWATSDPSAQTLWTHTDGVAKTWAQWQALGWDANSDVADPNFVDTTDFELDTGSPAIDTGTWFATISDVDESGTSFDVGSGEGKWFHGRFGTMVDEDGTAVNGTPITLSNGQTATVTAVSGDTITVSSSVTWTDGVTKVGIGTIYGTAPDIGANEYESAAPTNAIQGVSISNLNITDNLTAWNRSDGLR